MYFFPGFLSGHDPTRRSCQELLPYLAGRMGSGREVVEIVRNGSGRVGSEFWKSNGTGRDGLP